MIYTVTLNPAIDKTIKINDFRVNQVNRVTDQREDAGGKGINVSKMIYNFKGDTVAVMITGGSTGQR
jgi:1-phosphofructokinase